MAFPMFAYANGLVSAKLYVFFNGTNWLSLTLLAAFSYPLILNLGFYLIANLDPELAKNLTGGSLSQETLMYLTVFLTFIGTSIGTF